MIKPLKNPPQPASIVEGSELKIIKNQSALSDRVQRNLNRVYATRQAVWALKGLPNAHEIIPFHRIEHCCNYLAFNNYIDLAQIKLASANFCQVHLICSQCAQRRATLYAQEILLAVQQSNHDYLQLITLTVRNSHDLLEVLNRLFKYFKTLTNRFMRKNVKNSITNDFIGGVWTIEITYNPETGFHPHIHGLIASTKQIYTGDVRAEWESISNGDSYICDSSPINYTNEQERWKAIVEVCKYTLKNTSLPPDILLEVFQALKGKRLIRRFGTFKGKKISLEPDLIDFKNERFNHYVFQYLNNKYEHIQELDGFYQNADDFNTNRKTRKFIRSESDDKN